MKTYIITMDQIFANGDFGREHRPELQKFKAPTKGLAEEIGRTIAAYEYRNNKLEGEYLAVVAVEDENTDVADDWWTSFTMNEKTAYS